jgi:hypothetical protein
MAARPSLSESNVVSPLEDALDLVICLRGLRNPPAMLLSAAFSGTLKRHSPLSMSCGKRRGFPSILGVTLGAGEFSRFTNVDDGEDCTGSPHRVGRRSRAWGRTDQQGD